MNVLALRAVTSRPCLFPEAMQTFSDLSVERRSGSLPLFVQPRLLLRYQDRHLPFLYQQQNQPHPSLSHLRYRHSRRDPTHPNGTKRSRGCKSFSHGIAHGKNKRKRKRRLPRGKAHYLPFWRDCDVLACCCLLLRVTQVDRKSPRIGQSYPSL